MAVWGGQACDVNEHAEDDLRGKVVLVERGTCPFFTKVQNCLSKGASAVLVQDDQANTDLHKMGCGAPHACADAELDISAALISYANGQKLSQLVNNSISVALSLSAVQQGEHILGVDYMGRLREFGRIPPVGVDAVHSWHFVALEAAYYDYQRTLEQEVQDDKHTRISLFDATAPNAQMLSGGPGITTEVDMLPWREMQDIDTMKIYMKLECPSNAEKTCGAWDYTVQLRQCSRDSESGALQCGTELARWITPYARPGEWVTDVSSLLPLIKVRVCVILCVCVCVRVSVGVAVRAYLMYPICVCARGRGIRGYT